MQLKKSICLCFLVLLSGCDQLTSQYMEMSGAKPVALVIPPGYEISMAGKSAKVFGYDSCPRDGLKILGPSDLDGSQECLVLQPEVTKTVRARILVDGKLTDEEWTVDRLAQSSNALILRRSDGSPVVTYNSKL